ncbi:carboxylesterase family protein [Colletotrichum truncatum]|uniref:Carboxylesterase family protein n=1 Tax=Colletotrichum truncatum TaxID=5467 RepID=A0ACC3ZBF7_COLTU
MSDPRMNEDCLFLDVHVPENVFRNKNSKKKGVAVMAWIHGGGYDLGYKHDEQFDPAGLITRSQINNQEGIIFVSLNYRLGMFGFLPGVGDSITRNVGFLDQRLALDWIQKHIRAFGGDPHRVTIIGSSAGAGSVMHQITAFGGEGKVPFSSAIAQSPSVRATINDTEVWEKTIQAASTVLGEEIETAEQLRQLNSSVLMNVNQAVVFNGSYGLFTYGPTVDGTFVPDIPSVLLLNGRFHDDVKVSQES